MKNKQIHIIISFVLILFHCFSLSNDVEEDTKIMAQVDQLYQTMSLEQKVGQLFILGYKGTSLTPKTKKIIKTIQPGGLIAFKRNISTLTQAKLFNEQTQTLSKNLIDLPLLLMIDQEGGDVTRIKTRPLPPSALSLGQVNKVNYTYNLGASLGHLLSSLGFNMNLAPVVDLSDPNKFSFIGNRSFSKSPSVTSLHALNFSYGLLRSKVLPTYKHFPGHGKSQSDSHKTLPYIDISIQKLLTEDLIPYIDLAKKDLPSAIMVSHVKFPQLDPLYPATFSKKIVQDILKNQLNYTGLVITDDLDMAAAKQFGNTSNRAVQAVKAGNDMIMIAWNIDRQIIAFKSLVKAFRENKLPASQLENSVKKIISTKLKLSIEPDRIIASYNEADKLKQSLSDIKQISESVAKENFMNQLVNTRFLEQNFFQSKFYIFSADSGFYNSFKNEFNQPTDIKYISLSRKIKLKIKEDANFYSIFYVTGVGSAKLLKSLPDHIKKKTLVVNSTFPGIIDSDDYLSVVNTSSKNFLAGGWIARQLSLLEKKNSFL